MARTVTDAIAAARDVLNDEDGGSDGATYRTSDAKLRGYALDGINAVRNIRPDLFLGNWGDLAALAADGTLPLADQFFRPVVSYMVGMAELKDDEHVNSGRAKLMADLLQGFLR
jgi:hypothetical protein